MKLKYDAAVDILTITLSESRIAGSTEIAPGTIVDFDDGRNVVSIEILDAGDKYPLDDLAKVKFEKVGTGLPGQ